MDLKIAVLPGDGIGPEIIEQAIKAIDATCKKYGHTVGYTYGSVGATAIDKTGNPYPEETHRICMQSDAVLFGAIGDPRFDNNPQAKVRPEQGLLEMRKKLGLYANLRPVSTFKSLVHRSPLRQELVEGADFICIRELTGGIYFGQPQGRSEDGQTAFDSCVYTKAEIKRICRLGFEYAMKRRNKLTVVDKANVLATSRLWRETVQEMAPAYPQVNVEYMFVDNAAMKLIQQPKHFDVIVTENMFGDILTDEASVIRLIRLAAFRFYRYPHLAVRTDPRFLSSGRRQKCGQSSGNHFIRRYDVRICLQPESSRSKHPPGSRSFGRSRYRYRRYR